MTGWTKIEHTIKRRPRTHMRAAGCGLILSLSPTNYLGGNFGRKTSVADRFTRN
jgi:hypothetical protein